MNISVVQLNHPGFVDTVARVLDDVDIEPKYLDLEITESIATKEAEHIPLVLKQLKVLGVCISIDDFGTEYSSLGRLKHLPIDRIKIDMQFVHGIETNTKDHEIIKVMIALAKSLDLKVIAERVETDGTGADDGDVGFKAG